MTSPNIHPTAVIAPDAQLAEGVTIAPYSVIQSGVRIGASCEIGCHCVIGPNTILGERNKVHHHAVLGNDSQDRKYKGGNASLEIGNDNVFREFVTVNRSTHEGGATRIGDHCLILAYSHVAHDCVLQNHVLLSNGTQLAGEVEVADHVTTGGLVGVHQFCRLGAHAMIGACSKVVQDIPPYLIVDGHPARPHGLNTVGLERGDFAEPAVTALRHAYRELFMRGRPLRNALEVLQNEAGDFPEVHNLIDFIRHSHRGIARPRSCSWDDVD